MRRFDKKKNMEKANLLVESRYIKENTITNSQEDEHENGGVTINRADKTVYVNNFGTFSFIKKGDEDNTIIVLLDGKPYKYVTGYRDSSGWYVFMGSGSSMDYSDKDPLEAFAELVRNIM